MMMMMMMTVKRSHSPSLDTADTCMDWEWKSLHGFGVDSSACSVYDIDIGGPEGVLDILLGTGREGG